MLPNKTKAKLQAGEAVFGCFLRFANAGLVELIGYQAWDFLVFDGEHGPLEPHDCEHMVRAAELRDVTPIVRVTTNQAPIILRFMDTGAQGAHVPTINSASEAEAVVQAVKYYPRGTRGLAGVRAADYGQNAPLGEYVKRANDQTMVIVHIETAAAVDQISDIAAVEGVDVVFIGPADLSQSLGFPGEAGHPTVQNAIDKIVGAVDDASPALGIFVSDAESADQWRKRGARYIATSLEAILGPAMRGYLNSV